MIQTNFAFWLGWKIISRSLRFAAQLTMVCLLIIALTGCECIQKSSLTYHVWNNDTFQRFREPALDPKIEVFTDAERKDFLVVYDEVRDTTEDLHRRAFFLGANQHRLAEQRKPSFLNPKLAANLEMVPLNGNTNKLPFAVFGKELAIHTEKGVIGPYVLPTYENKSGMVLRILVSPFAVTGDVVIGALLVGSVAGLIYVYGGGSGSL